MKKIIAIAWIALAGAWADNISAGDITLQKGETKTVNISLTNTESNLVSFQIDLTLPEGISINKAGCSLSNRISDPDQELAIGKQGNNVYRIASTSFALTPISGTSGTLLTLSLTASANSEGGTATLSNIRFFTSNSERVTMSNASCNIGMAITFADANVKALCVQNWDTNGDGELSEAEAAAVTDLGEVFKQNTTITSFDELQYFVGLTSIGNDAFRSCSGLTSVTIPEGVTSIGHYTFLRCSGLTSLTIPNSLTSIGYLAFAECTGLTSLAIPNSVTSIVDGAFVGCSGLTSVVVENGNTVYDSREDCNAIIRTADNVLVLGCQNTVIPNSVTKIEHDAFCGCTNLTSVTIPNSVTSIGHSAFESCSGLTSIDIPNSVTSIEVRAFYSCSSLTSVTIPNSVTSIEHQAFWCCSNLTSVTVEMETPLAIESETFSNRANTTLYVPAGCKAAYEAADYWKEFKEIVEMAELYAVPENFTPADNQEIQATASVKLVYGDGGGWSQSYYDSSFEEFPYRVSGTVNPQLAGTLPYYGTFYSFTPSQDGYIEIAVSFDSGKSFYIAGLSDAYNYSGDAVLTDINGNVVTLNSDYQVSEQFTGTVKLGIKKGETYLMFCNSTKYCCLYGFRFTPGEVIEDTGTPHEPQAWDFTSYLSEADKANIAADGNWTISPVYDTNEYGNTTNEIRTYCYEYTQAFDETPVTANGVELGLTQGLKFKTKIDYNKNYFKYYDGERLHHAGSKNGPIIPDCGKGDVVKIRYKINVGGRGFEVKNAELTEGTLIGETEGIYEATLTVKRKAAVVFSSVSAVNILALAVNTDLPKIKNPVTITADSYTIEYGDELPEFTFTTEGSEPEGTPVIICDATASSPAGTYDITIDASNVANSQVTIVNGTLTINKAELTASVGEYTIQKGDNIPAFDISYSGFKNNEDKSVLTTEPIATCEATPSSPAGTYPITLAGGEAANYEITFVEGTLTVEEAPLEPTDISQIDNVIYMEPQEVPIGSRGTLSFKMKNIAPIRGFQFDLYLPEGMTVATSSNGKVEASLDATKLPEGDSHLLTASIQDGFVRFLCSSQYDENFATGDDIMMTLKVNVSEDMTEGEYPIELKTVKLSETDVEKYYLTELVRSKVTVGSYLLGDVNADGVVDISDYISMANYIHGNVAEGFVFRAGDIDGNGSIDISDYIGVSNIIHTGSPSGNSQAGAKAAVFLPEESQELDPE